MPEGEQTAKFLKLVETIAREKGTNISRYSSLLRLLETDGAMFRRLARVLTASDAIADENVLRMVDRLAGDKVKLGALLELCEGLDRQPAVRSGLLRSLAAQPAEAAPVVTEALARAAKNGAAPSDIARMTEIYGSVPQKGVSVHDLAARLAELQQAIKDPRLFSEALRAVASCSADNPIAASKALMHVPPHALSATLEFGNALAGRLEPKDNVVLLRALDSLSNSPLYDRALSLLRSFESAPHDAANAARSLAAVRGQLQHNEPVWDNALSALEDLQRHNPAKLREALILLHEAAETAYPDKGRKSFRNGCEAMLSIRDPASGRFPVFAEALAHMHETWASVSGQLPREMRGLLLQWQAAGTRCRFQGQLESGAWVDLKTPEGRPATAADVLSGNVDASFKGRQQGNGSRQIEVRVDGFGGGETYRLRWHTQTANPNVLKQPPNWVIERETPAGAGEVLLQPRTPANGASTWIPRDIYEAAVARANTSNPMTLAALQDAAAANPGLQRWCAQHGIAWPGASAGSWTNFAQRLVDAAHIQ